jgi:hypothetical protein
MYRRANTAPARSVDSIVRASIPQHERGVVDTKVLLARAGRSSQIAMGRRVPSCAELQRGCRLYRELEPRGPLFFQAAARIDSNWGQPDSMAYAVQTLLASWNPRFPFSPRRLTACLARNIEALAHFRGRDISTISSSDHLAIETLFNSLLEALRRTSDNRKSPVSVAKALALLAPTFFPLWDMSIAKAYKCSYHYTARKAEKYLAFCYHMKELASYLVNCVPTKDRCWLLKRIDEYNYSRYVLRCL